MFLYCQVFCNFIALTVHSAYFLSCHVAARLIKFESYMQNVEFGQRFDVFIMLCRHS